MMEAVNSIRVRPVALYILPNRQLPEPETDVYPDNDDDWYELEKDNVQPIRNQPGS